MTAWKRWVIGCAASLVFSAAAFGQSPDGRLQNDERTTRVYREVYSTETREYERIVQVPVTEYEWEPYWVNRWNLFATPYIAYRLTPRTRLELRTELVRAPITSSRLVPVERTVRVTERWSDSAPAGSVPAPPTAQADGRVETGARQLASDPPRQATSFEWRPAGGTRGRY
jgi:hypothetical protein